MLPAIEEKSMIPTILVGLGGTGAEVLLRVRQLTEANYGDLKRFPILSFLWIDTDKDYRVNQSAASSLLQDHEQLWTTVKGYQGRDILTDMHHYPWVESWFPKTLAQHINALETGAGQIRTYGRFAFFCHYLKIREKFNAAHNQIKGHEDFMLDEHGIRVLSHAVNVFVVSSLSGGTGSGMIIDLAYCMRHWLQEQESPVFTAIASLPNAFTSSEASDRLLANSYAALMELNYFSDHKTEYVAQFGKGLATEIRNQAPPFDFTYLVGTKNGKIELTLDQLWEMIAQNIFLDLTADFAPYKRSIRDNIQVAWSKVDPGGRGFPKCFMSFGLAMIEIPIGQIRASLSNRLGGHLSSWWLNDSVSLPSTLVELVQNDICQQLRFTKPELLTDLISNDNKSFLSEIAIWINSIRKEIFEDNKLQCTSQGVNFLGPEKGNILQFLDYLQPKVEEYRAQHLQELSPDERAQGDFLRKMYENRDRVIQQGKTALEQELNHIIQDRSKGLKFADEFIIAVRQLFKKIAEECYRESEKAWQPNEIYQQQRYAAAAQKINYLKSSFDANKQAQVEQYCDELLNGLEGSLVALIQRKSRSLGLEVIARLREHLEKLEQRLSQFQQKLRQLQDEFQQAAEQEAENADALKINGLQLYDHQELNSLYQRMIESLAGEAEDDKSRYELGMDQICRTLSADILPAVVPLVNTSQPLNINYLNYLDINYEDFKAVIANNIHRVVCQALEQSHLKQELTASDRLYKLLQDEPNVVRKRLNTVYQRSRPQMILSQVELSAAELTPIVRATAALNISGEDTHDSGSIKLLPYLQDQVENSNSIIPLTESEQYRIIFIQEIGGFSLRCVESMKDLRRSYQDWQEQLIQAKRAKLRGESRDLPFPIHIHKEPPFWDVFPEDPNVFRLFVQARALGILRQEENRDTREKTIFYTRKTLTSPEQVDIASSWEEAIHILEGQICRSDREAIQRQILKMLATIYRPEAKHAVYDQLVAYLKQREMELKHIGGRDSLEYKRELLIIEAVIESRNLLIGEDGQPLVVQGF